jgi:hypothetical protein
MGIDTDIRNKWFKAICPTAFVTLEKLESQRDAYLARDFLNWLRKINPEDRHTGRSLFELLYNSIGYDAKRGVRLLILICDYQNNVPKEKADTQAERREAALKRGFEPYPRPGTGANGDFSRQLEITEDGLRVWGVDDREQPYDYTETFTMGRLTMSSHLRLPLCRFIAKQLARYGSYEEMMVVWQYDHQAPLLVHGMQHRYAAELTLPTHGEYDISVWYWTKILDQPGAFIIHETTDSDEIPTALAYLDAIKCPMEAEEGESKLYWRYDYEEFCDLKALYREVLQNSHHNVQELLLGCILSGCDYFKKKRLCHQFGFKDIFFAVGNTESGMGEGFDKDVVAAVTQFVRVLYSMKFREYFPSTVVQRRQHKNQLRDTEQKTTTTVKKAKEKKSANVPLKSDWPASLRRLKVLIEEKNLTRKLKKFTFPSKEDIEAATKRIVFTYKYWTECHRQAVPSKEYFTVEAITDKLKDAHLHDKNGDHDLGESPA